MMGKGVVKVIHRCDDAKENQNLGELRVNILMMIMMVTSCPQTSPTASCSKCRTRYSC